MRRCLCLLALALLAQGCGRPATQAKPTVQHVLIVSIDGLRPDMLLRANTPIIRGLMRSGCYTMWARTTEVSITLPSHVSMLTGVTPERHAIWWNIEVDKEYLRYPAVPTIFQLAKEHGHTTALAVGKAKLEALGKPGSLDWAYWPDPYAEAQQVAREARKIIETHKPNLFFIHFPDVDERGHSKRWGSPQQVNAIERCDQAMAVILASLRRAGIRDKTAIILTSDHGGAGYGHGPDDARSRHIPWIITGPGIQKNVDLTTKEQIIINTEDTFATACFLLNIPIDEDVDGKAVLQVLEDPKPGAELLTDSPKPAATQGYVPYKAN
jgi:predicted AlkP superfamily pyrophosphatase or phosphodiesterase